MEAAALWKNCIRGESGYCRRMLSNMLYLWLLSSLRYVFHYLLKKKLQRFPPWFDSAMLLPPRLDKLKVYLILSYYKIWTKDVIMNQAWQQDECVKMLFFYPLLPLPDSLVAITDSEHISNHQLPASLLYCSHQGKTADWYVVQK